MGRNYIVYNGEYMLSDSPVLNIQNRAFRYGDALFETIRAINGLPCFINDHYERITSGMKMLEMDLPDGFSPEFLEEQTRKLVKKNRIKEGARVRLTVFRNFGGLFAPEVNDVSWIIEARKMDHNEYTLNQGGLAVDLYEEQRRAITSYSNLKSSNALFYILAGLYKRNKGLDECIVLNDLGSISEAISSNLFVVFNGVLYTPALSEGCIPGVMRKNIIEVAKQYNIEVQECPLNPAVLLKADEVFLTNTIKGLRWVETYREMRYKHEMATDLVNKLNARVANSVMDLQES